MKRLRSSKLMITEHTNCPDRCWSFTTASPYVLQIQFSYWHALPVEDRMSSRTCFYKGQENICRKLFVRAFFRVCLYVNYIGVEVIYTILKITIFRTFWKIRTPKAAEFGRSSVRISLPSFSFFLATTESSGRPCFQTVVRGICYEPLTFRIL